MQRKGVRARAVALARGGTHRSGWRMLASTGCIVRFSLAVCRGVKECLAATELEGSPGPRSWPSSGIQACAGGERATKVSRARLSSARSMRTHALDWNPSMSPRRWRKRSRTPSGLRWSNVDPFRPTSTARLASVHRSGGLPSS